MLLLNKVSYVAEFSLSAHWLYLATPFWSAKFLQRNQQIALWGFLVYDTLFFLAAFRIFSLFLTFAILIMGFPGGADGKESTWNAGDPDSMPMIRLGVGLFGFILFCTLCASCTWISVSFFRFGQFSAIIFPNTFSIPFSLLFLTFW